MTPVRVVVTRPEPGLSRTATGLAGLGFEPVRLPLSEIRTIAEAVPLLHGAGADVYVATSAAALRAAGAAVDRTKRLFAVGAATAEVARAIGFQNVVEGPGTGAALADLVIGHFEGRSPQRLVYLAGRPRTPDFERAMQAAGIGLEVVEIYEAVERSPSAEEIHRAFRPTPFAVLLFSRNAALSYARLVLRTPLIDAGPAVRHLCLSAQVAGGLASITPSHVFVSQAPSEASMLDLVAALRN